MASPVQTLPAAMTSLPMPTRSDRGPVPPVAAPNLAIGNPNAEDEQFLLRAFHTFSEAAGSLEKSYATLRSEVGRLRQELEGSNRDLAQSLEENRNVRAHLDRILEGLPCGVLVVSGNGRITRANPEAWRLLGRNQNGDGAPLFISMLPSDVRLLLAHARNETPEQEMTIECHSGLERWLAARHASIVERGSSASVYILRDVSEGKRLEETQAKLRREEALAEMSTILAHEIRNPLGSLELFAGLLAESQMDPECHQWVEHMQAGLRTLSATVNNVLHFHSLPEPERSPVDLSELLTWARDFFAPLTRQAGVTLSLQNAPGALIAADRHRLEQVLSNLVLNALRAMPEGGWIELAGRKSPCGDSVEVVVSDTGSGISAEDLPHIFDPGFSTRAGGPGLGLAVCRRIVEQHGGVLRASSSEHGAKFTLVLPVMEHPVMEQAVLEQSATGVIG